MKTVDSLDHLLVQKWNITILPCEQQVYSKRFGYGLSNSRSLKTYD
jgi:hypothetical protein